MHAYVHIYIPVEVRDRVGAAHLRAPPPFHLVQIATPALFVRSAGRGRRFCGAAIRFPVLPHSSMPAPAPTVAASGQSALAKTRVSRRCMCWHLPHFATRGVHARSKNWCACRPILRRVPASAVLRSRLHQYRSYPCETARHQSRGHPLSSSLVIHPHCYCCHRASVYRRAWTSRCCTG